MAFPSVFGPRGRPVYDSCCHGVGRMHGGAPHHHESSHVGKRPSRSVEPQGFARLVKDIRAVESSMGDGVKKRYDSEVPIMKKLRLVG